MTKALSEGKAKSVPELYIVTAPNRKQGGNMSRAQDWKPLEVGYRNPIETGQWLSSIHSGLLLDVVQHQPSLKELVNRTLQPLPPPLPAHRLATHTGNVNSNPALQKRNKTHTKGDTTWNGWHLLHTPAYLLQLAHNLNKLQVFVTYRAFRGSLFPSSLKEHLDETKPMNE